MNDKFYEIKHSSNGGLKDAINSIWTEINRKLKKEGNELFVFDFTFVVHKGDTIEVNSTYKFIHAEYENLLKVFLDTGQALLDARNAIHINIYNQCGKGRKRIKSQIKEYSDKIENPKAIHFNEWNKFLEQKKYGGCSYIVFNRLSLGSEEIELGIYCIFKKPLSEVIDKNSRRLTDSSETLSKGIERRLHRFLLMTGQKHVLTHYVKEAVDQKNHAEKQAVRAERHATRAEKLATRAAISQVMARNMSHNLGSHVLSKYKSISDFDSVCDSANQQYLGKALNLNINILCDECKNSKSPPAKCDDCERFTIINQQAYFNEYLKNRMDFLADIATTDPSLESNLYLLRDISAAFDKNRILLDRISGLDGDISFDIAAYNKNTYQIQGNNDIKDILLSIPNDILGCQALYIIIENVIRNTAKHTKSVIEGSTNKILDFSINIVVEEFSENHDYYQISINDDLLKETNSIEKVVKDRNEILNLPFINKSTDALRDVGLGSIEMLVCAAYLRKIPLDQIEKELYKINEKGYTEKHDVKIPNILFAFASSGKDGKASLGYKMYLRKPQKLLIFDDKNTLDLTLDEIKNWRSKGITIASRNKDSNYPFREDYEYNHDFLVWLNEEDDFDEFYNKHKNILPRRILIKSDFGENGFTLLETPFANEKKLWDVYLPKLLKKKDVPGFMVSILEPDNYRTLPANCLIPRNVFIDNHHFSWENYKSRNDIYYEMRCSHHRLAKLNLKDSDNYDFESYLETVLTEVIIIDERIQANIVNSEKKYANRVLFKDYFEKMKVFIPSPKEANLNSPDFGVLSDDLESGKSVADGLRRYILSKIRTADFCVLHLGIIEKLFGENESKNKSNLEEKIKQLVGKAYINKVIVTTGRGKPTFLSGNFRYIPLAIIQNYVESLFDKYLLVKSLFNARRTK